MCNNWPDFPISVDGATGGLIGNTVIICGGVDSDGIYYHLYNMGHLLDECYSFTSEKTTVLTHMSVGRNHAASIALNDNTLWVTGGIYPNVGALASTEYVTMTKTMPGPDLQMAVYAHAMVAINSTCSMVIGGQIDEGEEANYCSVMSIYVKNSEYLF